MPATFSAPCDWQTPVLSGSALVLAALAALAPRLRYALWPTWPDFVRELPVAGLTVVAAAVPPLFGAPLANAWLLPVYEIGVIALGVGCVFAGAWGRAHDRKTRAGEQSTVNQIAKGRILDLRARTWEVARSLNALIEACTNEMDLAQKRPPNHKV
jgi:hypothetical protein